MYIQMLPLLKRSTDNLVAVLGEMVTSDKSFEAQKYVIKFFGERLSYDLMCVLFETLLLGYMALLRWRSS